MKNAQLHVDLFEGVTKINETIIRHDDEKWEQLDRGEHATRRVFASFYEKTYVPEDQRIMGPAPDANNILDDLSVDKDDIN